MSRCAECGSTHLGSSKLAVAIRSDIRATATSFGDHREVTGREMPVSRTPCWQYVDRLFRGVIPIDQFDPALGQCVVSFDVCAVIILTCVISLVWLHSFMCADRSSAPSIPIHQHAASAWKLISALRQHFGPCIPTEALTMTVHLSMTAQSSIVPETPRRTSRGRIPCLVISQDVPSDRSEEIGFESESRLRQLSSIHTSTPTQYPLRRRCLSSSRRSGIA